MSKNDNNIENLVINKIFNNDKYRFIVPIYQRNYAWNSENIEALLDDILFNDKNIIYYLGTIVSYKLKDGMYEVIDGQQRLTTLYLIFLYIDEVKNGNFSENLIKNELSFEAREKYANTFDRIKNKDIDCEDNAKEIVSGYNTIKKYFEEQEKKHNIDIFIEKLKKTEIVVITVPEKTDLNNYFKIMNTRGEQLEYHHIVKAKMIDNLKNDDDRKAVAAIWDACANMNYHIQRNFKREIRDILFSDDGLSLHGKDIDESWQKIVNVFNNTKNTTYMDTLENMLRDKEDIDKVESYEQEDNSYNSIINFPYFLLQVNAVLSENNNENMHDDKKLIKNLQEHFKDERSVKKFVYYMLKCRFLFDKYIVKKKNNDFNDNDTLDIKQYKYDDSNKIYNYYNTFKENYDNDNYTLDRLIKLQSTLRITYTSPRNMQWITEVLKYLNSKDSFANDALILKGITNVLEKYCISKIKDVNFEELKYGQIERIVFTYLDYILYRDNYNNIKDKLNNWIIQFRTSIEHFYPQNPENGDKWDKEKLDSFGNLALITNTDNSKFSNYYPDGKKNNFGNIIDKSPKLKLMASYDKWTEQNMEEHKKEIVNILNSEKAKNIIID